MNSSISLRAAFHGTDENPLLHYSESHLDTLGLSYFLALRRREAVLHPEFKILVLDDVLHSVDAEHRYRIASLLKQEFSDHQIIIVTHDRYFYDRLRMTLGTGGIRYLAISDWDLERGPIIGDSSTDLDRILSREDRLQKSAEELAAAGGRLFEILLKSLTERLKVAVLARFSFAYDVGSLWPPLAKKMRRKQSYVQVTGTILDDLDQNTWVRNKVGAHSDEAESNVTPEEVRVFADALARFYSSVHCETCGEFIAERKTDHWTCDCGTVAYP